MLCQSTISMSLMTRLSSTHPTHPKSLVLGVQATNRIRMIFVASRFSVSLAIMPVVSERLSTHTHKTQHTTNLQTYVLIALHRSQHDNQLASPNGSARMSAQTSPQLLGPVRSQLSALSTSARILQRRRGQLTSLTTHRLLCRPPGKLFHLELPPLAAFTATQPLPARHQSTPRSSVAPSPLARG